MLNVVHNIIFFHIFDISEIEYPCHYVKMNKQIKYINETKKT